MIMYVAEMISFLPGPIWIRVSLMGAICDGKSANISTIFAVPVANILGEAEIYLDAGSTINITCVVKHTPVPPSHVHWEHQGKVRVVSQQG